MTLRDTPTLKLVVTTIYAIAVVVTLAVGISMVVGVATLTMNYSISNL